MKKRKAKRQRSALIEITNAFLTLLVLAILAMAAAFVYFANDFYNKGDLKEDAIFVVERGNGLATISKNLRANNIISNSWAFQLGTRAQQKERSIRAGEYKIAKFSSMADVLKELTEGTPISYSVTIPEGFTSFEAVQRINKAQYLVGEIVEIPPEGTLLPDTYSFEKGQDRATIIARMSANLEKELADVWANRSPDLPLKTKEELLILASIIEKETGSPDERAEVAGVFVNRLKKNMRLQTDPSVIYGITLGKGPLGRGLRQSELDKETPYNTYVIPALPIGPIANPGRASLEAAANPAKTENIFFVAAGAHPSLGHLFAVTYADHQKNVALYRKAVARAEKEAKEMQETKDKKEAEEANTNNSEKTQ